MFDAEQIERKNYARPQLPQKKVITYFYGILFHFVSGFSFNDFRLCQKYWNCIMIIICALSGLFRWIAKPIPGENI